jgi:hypothetical protein
MRPAGPAHTVIVVPSTSKKGGGTALTAGSSDPARRADPGTHEPWPCRGAVRRLHARGIPGPAARARHQRPRPV